MSLQQKKILLAEDDEDDRDFFTRFLKDRNDIGAIHSVENGLQLLEVLRACSAECLPDMIILDQNMPKMNGLQTLVTLKSDPAYSHIPVMVYSTYANESLFSSCLEKGAAFVSSKPATKEDYYKMMDGFFAAVQADKRGNAAHSSASLR